MTGKSVLRDRKRASRSIQWSQLSMHWTLPRAWKRSISLVKQSMSIWSCLLQLLNCCISSSWKRIPCKKGLYWIIMSLVKKEWSLAGEVRTENQVGTKSICSKPEQAFTLWQPAYSPVQVQGHSSCARLTEGIWDMEFDLFRRLRVRLFSISLTSDLSLSSFFFCISSSLWSRSILAFWCTSRAAKDDKHEHPPTPAATPSKRGKGIQQTFLCESAITPELH